MLIQFARAGLMTVLLSMLSVGCASQRCESRPAPSQKISAKEAARRSAPPPKAQPPIVAAPDRNAAQEDTNSEMVTSLSDLNKKAGSPSFTFIRGFYQLPVNSPAGAAKMEGDAVFDAPYRSYRMDSLATDPYDVASFEQGRQSAVVGKAVRMVREANISLTIVEPSIAKILISKERSALEDGKPIDFRKMISKSEYLVTVQKGFVGDQSTFVGRVIRVRDGEVIALWKEPETVVYSMQPMLLGLVEEALKRIAQKKERA